LDYWCAGLSRAGYGSIRELKTYSSRDFFSILWYEQFINDYQAEAVAINRRDKK
jgi:hypothetical protein